MPRCPVLLWLHLILLEFAPSGAAEFYRCRDDLGNYYGNLPNLRILWRPDRRPKKGATAAFPAASGMAARATDCHFPLEEESTAAHVPLSAHAYLLRPGGREFQGSGPSRAGGLRRP